MTGRILLEVTEFQQTRHWYRHLSGVPRTVMELSRRLLADDELEVVCIFYNFEARRFFRAPAGLFDEIDETSDADVSGRGRARAGVARFTARVAERVGRVPVARKSYHLLRLALAIGRGANPIAFHHDDTVVALGAMWGSDDLTDALAGMQRAHRFRMVSLLYDLIPKLYPQYFSAGFPEQYGHYLDRVLEMSDTLFVISESTGRDLARYCTDAGLDQPPTRVVYLGDGALPSAGAHRPPGAPDGDFVLAVSTLEPRKNHQILYQAIKHAGRIGMDLPPIVVVGSPGWMTEDLQYTLRHDPEVRGALIWLPKTSDGELAWLYDHASFTVYPSIVEGWGLPIAEALSHGKFCITCDTSSMPEVGGDLVDYVSPWDAAAWAHAINRYASDPAALAERTARVRRDYRPRSWDDAAATVSDALRTPWSAQKRAPALDE